ncbi:MAG: glycoside hydrolase family 99-like domain-containing protein [Lachnospiraceae bacterium]|nr:glycoside hydrolase family 99-like domain-containing protein [Lachnospiraceae bacterium]
MVRIIAFYLPQFHEVPDNNKWWGKGFTEWTNVRSAKPIFTNQYQPNIPYKKNYYNLLQKETVQWQTELMNKYNVYAFCYFHYWFEGKKILEKPAENLLKWKDINQKFCFAWANTTWARTWTAINYKATSWYANDGKNDSNDNGILLKQDYGDINDWLKHYKYLSKFFKDERYIKVLNKPMILIYDLKDITDSNEMFSLWTNLAKQDGFDGLHIVSINQNRNKNQYVDAIALYDKYNKYDRHIMRSIYNRIAKKLGFKVLPNILDYKTVWKNIALRKKYNYDAPVYLDAFVKYDDTPRKGYYATYIKNESPEIFEKYLMIQMEKANKMNCQYIFLDAWNEWGEGNYLEPDERFGYKYLEALKNSVDNFKCE